MQNKTKKVFSIIGNTLAWIFLVFAILVTVVTFATRNAKDGVPSVFGTSIVSVQSDSMKSSKPESFKEGDLIFIEKITETQAKQLKVGDIITYRAPIDIDKDGQTGDINTHRIVSVSEDGGYVWFTTKGDNNATEDGYKLRHTDVIGVYDGGKLAGIGAVVDFLRSSLGFLLVIVLPMALFFLYEVYNLVKIIMAHKVKKARAEGISAVQEEEIKRLAIEEYLKNQQTQTESTQNTENTENSQNTEETK
jgi:signal peptidase